MIRLWSFTIISTLFQIGEVNGQTWQWAASLGSPEGEGVLGICIDSSNSVYVSGSYAESMVSGNDTIHAQTFASSFISKHDEFGNPQWLLRVDAHETDLSFPPGTKVFYDGFDNSILVSSAMSGSNQQIGNCNAVQGPLSEWQFHLAKIDVNGDCVWSKKLNDGFVISVASDVNGFIYAVVMIYPGGGELIDEFLQEGRYLVKFNSQDGSIIWHKRILEFSYAAPEMVYDAGVLWLAGNTGNSSTFTIDGIVESTFENDVFIAPFDTSGNILWVETFGGDAVEVTSHLAIDDEHNLYLSGNFQDVSQLGDSTIGVVGNEGVFIMKLDNQANMIWLNSAHSPEELYAYGAATDKLGNTVITGTFSNTFSIDNYTLAAVENKDGFVARFDSSGNCIGTKTIYPKGSGMILPAIDNNGVALIAGTYNDQADFDGIILNAIDEGNDVFVGKIDLKTSVPNLRMNANNELLIYSNPSKGQSFIQVPDEFLFESDLVLRIYGTDGALLKQTSVNMEGDRIKLSLEQVAKGVYVATLSSSDATYTGKIVLE